MSRLFVEAALAGGLRLSTVRHAVGLDDQPEPAGVRGMPVPGSLTAGTIFQDTRKPLTLWFRAIWWVTTQKNGASALGL